MAQVGCTIELGPLVGIGWYGRASAPEAEASKDASLLLRVIHDEGRGRGYESR